MRRPVPERSNLFYDTARFGIPQIRIYHRKGIRKRSPRYLLKCGCCEEQIEIFYGEDGLEIGGVHGAIDDWREILMPLLDAGKGTKRARKKVVRK